MYYLSGSILARQTSPLCKETYVKRNEWNQGILAVDGGTLKWIKNGEYTGKLLRISAKKEEKILSVWETTFY
jgi:hypothetical protein